MTRSGGRVTLPAIVVAVSDADRNQHVERELRLRYGTDYEVVRTGTVAEAMGCLERMHAQSQPVAIVLADRSLPDLDGAEFFTRTAGLFPDSRRGLLVDWGAWADPDVAQEIHQLIGLGRIHYYVLTPWRARDEYFHRTITEFLLEWERAAGEVPREVTIVGDPHVPRVHELESLLVRNGVPFASHGPESPTGSALLTEVGATAELPVVVVRGGHVLVDPTNAELVAAYGVPTELAGLDDVDLLVVGAGPAGLAGAVYAASEGLRTLVVERESIGGQAGSSSLIRNYLGFSRGISGAELAQRAYQQAWVFGANFRLTMEAHGLVATDDGYQVALTGGASVHARSIMLATGVSYRRIGIAELEALTGAGVFYGASVSEARLLTGRNAYVVGGGNSAGQAAMYLSRYARSVTLLVRDGTLATSMSRYLSEEMAGTPNVRVRYRTEVVGAGGAGRLEHLVLRDRTTGEQDVVPADGLFVLIGAMPRTDWLPEAVARDAWGYVLTGPDANDFEWPLKRPRLMLETSLPGVFAVGDVRSRSIKRVASAVGEGSVAISQVHQALAVADRV